MRWHTHALHGAGGDSSIENVDDADDFTKTKEALSLLGVSDDLQHQVWRGGLHSGFKLLLGGRLSPLLMMAD